MDAQYRISLYTVQDPDDDQFSDLANLMASCRGARPSRPRFGRVPKYATKVTPAEAPELYRLVGDVAAALSAPVPAVYVEEDVFNASASRVGLRRRPVLVLGLPLWNVLSAQQRVALLGHELGHFVNGDPRRGLLVQPAVGGLQRLDAWLVPVGMDTASIATRLRCRCSTPIRRRGCGPQHWRRSAASRPQSWCPRIATLASARSWPGRAPARPAP
jgi:hypothetical protein